MEKQDSDIACEELPKYSWTMAITYHALIATSLGLSLTASIYYAAIRPGSTQVSPIWDQNYLHPRTFTLDSILGILYWLNLFARQLLCLGIAVISRKKMSMDAIVDAGNHIIAFNFLHIGSVVLFTSSYFAWAEVILILNFANMSALYFRHHQYPLFIHSSLVSGPLSWTFLALYWNSFRIAPQSEVTRIVGSIFAWGMLGYGLFFAFAHKDYTMCLFLSFIPTSVEAHHATAKGTPLQLVPPIIIAVALFGVAIAINVSRWAKTSKCSQIVEEDSQGSVELRSGLNFLRPAT